MSAPCNFSDTITGEVVVPSTWRKVTECIDATCQTAPLSVCEAEVQTTISALQVINRFDKQVGHEQKKIQTTLDGLQYVYAGVEVDEGRLATFLEDSKSDVLSMLYRNAKSGAFNNYEPNCSTKSTDIASVATLSSPYAVEGELHVLALSWNSSGILLAVAYGRVDTAGWCHSSGVVSIWNLARPDIDVNAPRHTLEMDSFVTCVAFHPTQASVLAVGMYSGEVVMYSDVTSALPTKMSTAGSPLSHKEPVSSLQWMQSLQEMRESHRFILCSSAQDGCIYFWTPTNKLTQPLAAFSVESKNGVTVGVQSLRFARPAGGGGASVPSGDGLLIIGLENGDVGRARPGVVSALSLRSTDALVTLEVDWLNGHRGPVQSVDTSPFFHNLCLTCSSDGSVHLYNTLERSPLATLEPSPETKHFLYAAQFSPFRPSILAVVSRSSFLHFYDLQMSQLKPIASIEAGVDGAPVLCLAFNHTSPEWLVTGDTRGCVRLWRLPSTLIQTTDLERAAVRATHAHSSDESAMRSLLGFSL
ncbi:WD repeat domain 34 [Trypanosoma rangeli]|uniref:WD repeat domain 34 n=1 Tax=Trypanosoma rangeli TaxID=5698 RepID=A0A3S5IRX8_TRYRA|nr:WD repeat domain 34 [Trypanosoma rangeli]RNF09252.1 WD repeat domain 34 [Trypanosoma rangeli]|eukprot:RNF09252.1 WD repeat domain 34 [Trypanosoma rangeli]